jgi:hypothetical protein
MVKLSGGRIVEATVKAIAGRTDGVRLQVSLLVVVVDNKWCYTAAQ